MRLELCTPLSILVDAPVQKVSAEGLAGSFTLLPHHVDFISILTPGILTYQSEEPGEEQYLAVDEGILVKSGETVHVATRQALQEASIDRLQQAIANEFEQQAQEETDARASLHKLEADVVREFWRMKDFQ